MAGYRWQRCRETAAYCVCTSEAAETTPPEFDALPTFPDGELQ